MRKQIKEELTMYSKTVTLSNEVVVPQLALGTWLIDNDKVAEAVRAATAALIPVTESAKTGRKMPYAQE